MIDRHVFLVECSAVPQFGMNPVWAFSHDQDPFSALQISSHVSHCSLKLLIGIAPHEFSWPVSIGEVLLHLVNSEEIVVDDPIDLLRLVRSSGALVETRNLKSSHIQAMANLNT